MWPELHHLSSYYTAERVITCGLAHNALGYWVAFIPALIFWILLYSFDKLSIKTVDIPFGKATQYLFVPLLCGFLGGLLNNAVDFDHITLFFGHPNGRVAHGILFVAAFIVHIISDLGIFWSLMHREQKPATFWAALSLFATGSFSIIIHIAEDYGPGYF